MFKEFKEFAFRGNVIDLAIATIMGATFNNIISSIIDNIFMPIIGIVLGGKDYEKLIFQFGDAQLKYGLTIAAIIKFILVAIILFVIIKSVNKFYKKVDEAPAISRQEELLEEILKEMKKK